MIDKASKDDCGWSDFAHLGYKDTRFKFEVSNDGFGYFICENNEKSTVRCDITLSFKDTLNVKIIGKHAGMNAPTIETYSGEKTIVVYEILDYPATTQFDYRSCCIAYTNAWLEYIIKTASKTYYPHENKDIGIYNYIKVQPDSIIYIYKNTSTEYILEETVQYDMDGCHDYTSSRDGRHIEI